MGPNIFKEIAKMALELLGLLPKLLLLKLLLLLLLLLLLQLWLFNLGMWKRT